MDLRTLDFPGPEGGWGSSTKGSSEAGSWDMGPAALLSQAVLSVCELGMKVGQLGPGMRWAMGRLAETPSIAGDGNPSTQAGGSEKSVY